MATRRRLSTSQHFVQDGIRRAELHEFLKRELGEVGFDGFELRRTATRFELIVRMTNTSVLLANSGRGIRELRSTIEKRWGYRRGSIEVFVERVRNRALSAMVQAESLRLKIICGLPVGRACRGVARFCMDGGARAVAITIAGKLDGDMRARRKVLRYGHMPHSGADRKRWVDEATCHAKLRFGVLGVRVAILLPPPDIESGERSDLRSPLKERYFSDYVSIKRPARRFQQQND